MLGDRPIRRLAALIFPLLLLAGTAMADTVCESQVTRRKVGRNRHIVGREVVCYEISDSRCDPIERLQAACDLLSTAYGEKEGRARCQDLIEHSTLDR
jgi:hypothetical protein